MEVTRSSKMLARIYQAARRHVPEKANFIIIAVSIPDLTNCGLLSLIVVAGTIYIAFV
jgi:hypothetical protein